MQQLEALTREARDLANGLPRSVPSANETEVARQLQICNACRYCEGFCAVFPAMTRRLEFAPADVHYLANLCHNCGACLHACQYASPHEFAVNVPQAMARVRQDTYTDYAWPRPLGALYRRNGLTLALATAGALVLFLLLAVLTQSSQAAPGDFFAVFPHNTLVLMFGSVFAWALLALGLGVARFWREVSPTQPNARADSPRLRRDAALEATRDVLTLKHLGGGHGEGCNNEDDAFTLWRRRFHHCTFYGFLLCFASTCVATLYHYLLDRHAPFALLSLPVLLGSAGGVGLLVGPIGLLWLNLRRDPAHGDQAQRPMDRGFIALLLLVSASGLALLLWRDSRAMAWLLALHLGLVMALFLTLPYGKFAHGIFRSAALLKNAMEKRRPNGLQLGAD